MCRLRWSSHCRRIGNHQRCHQYIDDCNKCDAYGSGNLQSLELLTSLGLGLTLNDNNPARYQHLQHQRDDHQRNARDVGLRAVVVGYEQPQLVGIGRQQRYVHGTLGDPFVDIVGLGLLTAAPPAAVDFRFAVAAHQ